MAKTTIEQSYEKAIATFLDKEKAQLEASGVCGHALEQQLQEAEAEYGPVLQASLQETDYLFDLGKAIERHYNDQPFAQQCQDIIKRQQLSHDELQALGHNLKTKIQAGEALTQQALLEYLQTPHDPSASDARTTPPATASEAMAAPPNHDQADDTDVLRP